MLAINLAYLYLLRSVTLRLRWVVTPRDAKGGSAALTLL
jgi:hypothetical protein